MKIIILCAAFALLAVCLADTTENLPAVARSSEHRNPPQNGSHANNHSSPHKKGNLTEEEKDRECSGWIWICG